MDGADIIHNKFQMLLELPRIDENTGFLHCSGIAARSGVQPYRRDELPAKYAGGGPPDEFIAVYRDAEFIEIMAERFNAGSIPLTNEHFFVDGIEGENQDKIIGWIKSAAVKKQGKTSYLIIDLVIFDQDAILQVLNASKDEEGHIGLSVGYTNFYQILEKDQEWLDTEGIVGEPGTPYRYNLVAVHPTVNHLAKCELGRAGLVTKITLDSLQSLCGPSVVEDQQSLYKYKYPEPKKQTTMDKKEMQDMISSAMGDFLSSDAGKMAMADAMKSCDMVKGMMDAIGPKIESSLYGAFGSKEVKAAIAEMFGLQAEMGRPSNHAGEKQVQNDIQSQVAKEGYMGRDSFKAAVVDSITVWKEVGEELVAGGVELGAESTGDELRAAYCEMHEFNLGDSVPVEVLRNCYDSLRKRNGEKKQAKKQTDSVISSLFAPKGKTTDSVSGKSFQDGSGLIHHVF